MNEFELIRRYFADGGSVRDDVVMGIGDDAAVLRVPDGMDLVTTTDSLVAGVHFPSDLDPEATGHRALAINLSDLAAMGAEPAWALLALTLPAADEAWLAGFSHGFLRLAERYGVALVGGNVARGPLNATVTANGFVPRGQLISRSGARPGDLIFVTGHPGDAAAGLRLLQTGNSDTGNPCVRRFAYPEPRVAAGIAVRDLVSAGIDISDGLVADLGHLLEAGNLGADLNMDRLPLSSALLDLQNLEFARELALTAGDDYELCLTLPPANRATFEERLRAIDCPCTCIGTITLVPGVRCIDAHGGIHWYAAGGHQHFR